MHDLIDLETYPLHRGDSAAYRHLVTRCREDLAIWSIGKMMKSGAVFSP